jgi:hypothetical protein
MHTSRNPSHVASPSIAGHRYAFLVTANRWLELSGNDSLEVEGNEDIDVVTTLAGQLHVREVQVKRRCRTSPACLRRPVVTRRA